MVGHFGGASKLALRVGARHPLARQVARRESRIGGSGGGQKVLGPRLKACGGEIHVLRQRRHHFLGSNPGRDGPRVPQVETRTAVQPFPSDPFLLALLCPDPLHVDAPILALPPVSHILELLPKLSLPPRIGFLSDTLFELLLAVALLDR